MNLMRPVFTACAVLGLLAAQSIGATAARDAGSFAEAPSFSLAQNAAAPADQPKEQVTTETRSETVEEHRQSPGQGEEWDIWAPIRMRSANPQDTGQVQILQGVDYSTSSDGTDDDARVRLDIEWGFAPNHQLSLGIPTLLGDGDAEGNTNLELGWQWRLWEEKDLLPAFALLNELYIPSGSDAAGVDWRLTGLFTKSITDRWRLHLNPFLMVASGDSPQPRDERYPGDLRDFQWGFVTGTDYLLTDDLALTLDYVHETSEYEGNRNQHYMEAGMQWAISERHGLGLATRWTLDGDDVEDNWGMTFSYSYTFNAPAIVK